MTSARSDTPTLAAADGWSVVGGVKHQLAELVTRLAAEGRRQLPSEDELSDLLRASRSTVRSALQELENAGKVRRRQGKGTFINSRGLYVGANLAEDHAFVDLLAERGYRTRIRTLGIRAQVIPADMAERLELPASERVCVVERVYEADGEPAMVVTDYVPLRFLRTEMSELCGEESTFAFVERYTGRSVAYSVAQIRPARPDRHTCATLRVTPSVPVLLLDHTHVDADEHIVALTRACVNDRYLRFSVVRTRTRRGRDAEHTNPQGVTT